MSTVTTLTAPSVTTTTGTRHPVRRATVVSGAVAAAATTAIAAVATAGEVPLAIDGEQIPLAGFAQMTVLASVIGGLLVAALNRWTTNAHRVFVRVAVALTVLSCVPSVALPQDAATKIVLVATHAVAAIIVVPALARQTRS